MVINLTYDLLLVEHGENKVIIDVSRGVLIL